MPSLSQAKEKLRRIQTKKFPSSDEIVNIGEMFHKNILSLTTLDAKVGTMLTMTNDTLTQTLRTSEFMMMDGTFGVSNTDRTKRNAASLHIYREFKLRIETQLYLIGGFLQDHFLPLVYSYMGSRTTHAYVHLFCSVRNAIFSATEQAWMPPAVIIDHETAVIKALQFVFPGIDLWYVRAFWLIQCAGVQIYTCYFHVLQATKRKLGNITKGSSTIHNSLLQESFRRVVVADTRVRWHVLRVTASLSSSRMCLTALSSLL